ncbi:MAG: hypothetical protein ACXWMB_06500 [Candidatus Limnocylindria bacterium]
MTRRLACVALLLLAAGCAAAPATSPSASFAPSASAAGSESAAPPSPSILAFPVVSLPPDSRAQLTDALPFAEFFGGPTVDMLASGTSVIIAGGPRDVGGGTWYVLLWSPAPETVQQGAFRVDDASVLASVELPCPEAAGGVLALQAWDRVRCFGGVSVTVEGTVGHCQGGVVQVDPGWLGYACWTVHDDTGAMNLHADPASGITFPDELVRARMTGHFDDPAATTCVYLGEPDPGTTPSAWEQIFMCREAFVVDTFEILEVVGTPPAA